MDTMIKSGEMAPDFKLPDLNGNLYTLSGSNGWIRVLNFWSAECTWCERVDHELIPYITAWKDRVKVIWIASNANETPNLIAQVAKGRSIPIMLLDYDQRVADIYGAQTTPHFFIIDDKGELAYQGAWDDITFRKRVATQVYVPMVVESMMQGHTPFITQTPAYGCLLVRYSEPSG